MNAKGFEGLKVWQLAHELMLIIHKQIVPKLPADETWDLASQIRRSSKSVGANIAEGYGRYYYQDNARFCYNARGSLDETINHLCDALDLGYIHPDLCRLAREKADHTRRALNGYIGYLKQKKIGDDEPGAHVSPYPCLSLRQPTPPTSRRPSNSNSCP